MRLKCRLGTSPRVLLSRKDCSLFLRPPLHNDRTFSFIFHPSLSAGTEFDVLVKSYLKNSIVISPETKNPFIMWLQRLRLSDGTKW